MPGGIAAPSLIDCSDPAGATPDRDDQARLSVLKHDLPTIGKTPAQLAKDAATADGFAPGVWDGRSVAPASTVAPEDLGELPSCLAAVERKVDIAIDSSHFLHELLPRFVTQEVFKDVTGALANDVAANGQLLDGLSTKADKEELIDGTASVSKVTTDMSESQTAASSGACSS